MVDSSWLIVDGGRKEMSEIKFSFEDLEVWQKSVDFAVSVIDIAEVMNTNRKHYRLIEQLESSATSMAVNTCPVK